jgi:chromosome segregation ATPase
MNESKDSSTIVGGESETTLLAKVREAVKQLEMDFQAKETATEELLRESHAKEQAILDMLDNRVSQLMSENAEFGQQLEGLKQQLSTTEKEKAEAEKKAEGALNDVVDAEDKISKLLSEKAEVQKVADAAIKENEDARKKLKAALDERAEMGKKLAEASSNAEAFNREIASLKEELTKAATMAEIAVKERDQFQDKLVQFQANWEKYIVSK